MSVLLQNESRFDVLVKATKKRLSEADQDSANITLAVLES